MSAPHETPGTKAYLRWHKDDSPDAMLAYRSMFVTQHVLHPHEVTDAELAPDGRQARSLARHALNAGRVGEPQQRSLRDHQGLQSGESMPHKQAEARRRPNALTLA